MLHIVAMAIPIAVVAVTLLVLREASQRGEMVKRLRSDAPRDLVGRARHEVRSRVRYGPGTGGRPPSARDMLHWGAFLSLAYPLVVYWLALDVYQRAWVILAWLPLPAVAWWLSMRRDGVRHAHRLPLATWTVAYVALVMAFTFQDDAIRSSLADYYSRFQYLTDARIAVLIDRELNPFFSPVVSGAVLIFAAMTIVVAVATMGMRSGLAIDGALTAAALLIGGVAWSSNQHGVVVAVIGALIVGYAIARAVRIDRETLEYRRALAVLDADAAASGHASARPISPAKVASVGSRADGTEVGGGVA